jgi:DNA-binding CsgD family transcriptional regulator
MDQAVALANKAAHNPTIAPLAFALLGEAQAAAGDMEAAQRTASRLAGLGPGAPYPAALAAWVSGLAAGTRRDPARALGALDQLDIAVAGFAELGMPYEEAVARLDRALVRRAAGDSASAVAADINGALEVLDRLEAKPQADRARAALRQLGRRPATASAYHEERRLSVREQEVARLVAQGLSNAEVGERLFITTRTVATHLQHIYRRLELPSRAALIRYILEDSPSAITWRDMGWVADRIRAADTSKGGELQAVEEEMKRMPSIPSSSIHVSASSTDSHAQSLAATYSQRRGWRCGPIRATRYGWPEA